MIHPIFNAIVNPASCDRYDISRPHVDRGHVCASDSHIAAIEPVPAGYVPPPAPTPPRGRTPDVIDLPQWEVQVDRQPLAIAAAAAMLGAFATEIEPCECTDEDSIYHGLGAGCPECDGRQYHAAFAGPLAIFHKPRPVAVAGRYVQLLAHFGAVVCVGDDPRADRGDFIGSPQVLHFSIPGTHVLGLCMTVGVERARNSGFWRPIVEVDQEVADA